MDSNLLLYDQSPHLTPQFCDHVIHMFEEDDRKHQGALGDSPHVDLTVKSSIDLNITEFPEYHNENIRFKKALDTSLQCYKYLMEDINERLYPFYDCADGAINSGFQIQRTDPGGFYTWHSDDHWYSVTKNRRTETFVRGLTYIFYLNTVENDGYTEFIDGTRIQPKQGYYLIFPSTWTYVHRGFPPKDETKYIATGWIYGRKLTSADKMALPSEMSPSRPKEFTQMSTRRPT